MNTATLFIIFMFCFFAGAYLSYIVERLIKRRRAKKMYYRYLEKENVRLKNVVNLLRLELLERTNKK